MAATSLKSDPSPGTTPTPAVVIRTDQHNLIADLLNGVHASERPNLVQKRTSQTGSYTLDVADFLVECDATGGAFTVTLPSAASSGFKNKVFIVKKTDSGSNAITIDPNSTETIDGASTVTLDRQFQTIMLMSDGTNWKVLTSFFAIKNADIYTNAAIAYAKLNLSGSLVNADIAAGAAIALSKLAALTASRLLVSDGSGVITVSSVTATEAGYLSGVTSSIQTQIDGKLGTTLTSARIFVGNGSNVATGVAVSGDITINNTGAVTLATAKNVLGLQDCWIPAGAMWPRTTNGPAALAQTELSTNKVNFKSLDFDQTTQEFAQCEVTFARNYNNGTIKATPYWTFASGSGGVVWGFSGLSLRDDDAMDAAMGTAQTSTDTALTANDLHIGPQSAAITLAGTVADKNMNYLQVSRNPSDGSDTLAADAKLLGVVIEYTIDAATAA